MRGNENMKTIGSFLISYHTENDFFFDDDVRAVVYRNNTNNIYGFILKNGNVQLLPKWYKNTNKREITLSHKLYKRISDIYYSDADKRINNLYDYILKLQCTLDDMNNDYFYLMQYHIEDLY